MASMAQPAVAAPVQTGDTYSQLNSKLGSGYDPNGLPTVAGTGWGLNSMGTLDPAALWLEANDPSFQQWVGAGPTQFQGANAINNEAQQLIDSIQLPSASSTPTADQAAAAQAPAVSDTASSSTALPSTGTAAPVAASADQYSGSTDFSLPSWANDAMQQAGRAGGSTQNPWSNYLKAGGDPGSESDFVAFLKGGSRNNPNFYSNPDVASQYQSYLASIAPAPAQTSSTSTAASTTTPTTTPTSSPTTTPSTTQNPIPVPQTQGVNAPASVGSGSGGGGGGGAGPGASANMVPDTIASQTPVFQQTPTTPNINNINWQSLLRAYG